MRGQYAHNHGVRSNDGVNGGFPQFYNVETETSTLATWLQDGGYHTARVGKYFNAYPEGLVLPDGFSSPGRRHVPPGWDEWYGLVDIPRNERANPYTTYGYQMNPSGRPKRYGNDEDDYLTDVPGGLAVDFVDGQARRDTPFFLCLTPTAPRHLGMFDHLNAPRAPSFHTVLSDAVSLHNSRAGRFKLLTANPFLACNRGIKPALRCDLSWP